MILMTTEEILSNPADKALMDLIISIAKEENGIDMRVVTVPDYEFFKYSGKEGSVINFDIDDKVLLELAQDSIERDISINANIVRILKEQVDNIEKT